MKYCLIFCILLSINTYSQGKADGFYRGKGNGVVVLGIGYEDPKHYFAGTIKTDLSRTAYYVNLFSSYGITNNLDAQVSLPYISSNKNSDFQDISLFLKYRFYKNETDNRKFEMSFGSGFSTPVSNYDIGGLNDIGQQATIIDTRFMVHYQRNGQWFATLQSGFSFKLEETPNSIPATIKVGTSKNNWYYDLYYDYQYSFGGDDYLGSPRPQNFKEFGVNYHKVGGTVFTSVAKNLGVYASLSYLLSGRNSFQGAAYGVGLVYDFKKKN
jgi:hypothetical protein